MYLAPFFSPPLPDVLAAICGSSRAVQPLSVALDMQAGMQHPSLDGYEEVGVLGRG